MKKFFKKWWGVMSLIAVFLLEYISGKWAVQEVALRNGPLVSYIFCSAGALALTLYWMMRNASDWSQKFKGFMKTFVMLVLSALGVVGAASLAFTIMSYSDATRPEYAVEKQDMKMIAIVDTSDGVNVYYYEDKGGNFRGVDILGKEYYGEGSFDPFATEEKETATSGIFYDLEGNVTEQWGDKYDE